jgi:hypothetical protein
MKGVYPSTRITKLRNSPMMPESIMPLISRSQTIYAIAGPVVKRELGTPALSIFNIT